MPPPPMDYGSGKSAMDERVKIFMYLVFFVSAHSVHRFRYSSYLFVYAEQIGSELFHI